jgi:RimJ/RimL family protein N-acetyltransferase
MLAHDATAACAANRAKEGRMAMTWVVPEALVTERLRLRRPTIADAPDVFAYASDVEVTHFMDWPTHTIVGTVADWLEECASLWKSGAEFTWLIAPRSEDRTIGAISLRVAGYKADFGYVLNRHSWGRGLGTEAARAIVDLTAKIDGVYRLWATCDVENVASARVLEKAGLEREGILRRWAVRPNISSVPRDAYVYARIMRDA